MLSLPIRSPQSSPPPRRAPIPDSTLHTDGLVASAANSAARLPNFRLLFSARPSWALPCRPDLRHTDSATATARFHAGRCLRPRLRLACTFLLCFCPKIIPCSCHLPIFHISKRILVNAVYEVVALRHGRRGCGI